MEANFTDALEKNFRSKTQKQDEDFNASKRTNELMFKMASQLVDHYIQKDFTSDVIKSKLWIFKAAMSLLKDPFYPNIKMVQMPSMQDVRQAKIFLIKCQAYADVWYGRAGIDERKMLTESKTLDNMTLKFRHLELWRRKLNCHPIRKLIMPWKDPFLADLENQWEMEIQINVYQIINDITKNTYFGMWKTAICSKHLGITWDTKDKKKTKKEPSLMKESSVTGDAAAKIKVIATKQSRLAYLLDVS